MLRCVRCGTANPDGSQYCDECGAKLTNSGAADTGIWQSSRLTMIDNETNTDIAEAEALHDSLVGWKASGEHKTEVNQGSTRIAGVQPFAHARLVIERGKNAGKEFALGENEIHIGRWDADNGIFPDVDLDADDPEAKVSRRHARIVRLGDQYLIEDLGSTNGTFVNRGRRLLPGNRQIIQDGDEVIVGKTFLRFQIIR